MAPVTVMNTALTANSSSLAVVVLMPTWVATVSSSPITRSARPRRERLMRARSASTRASMASNCQ